MKDTLNALDMGAVEILILYENLDTMRLVVRNNQTSEESVIHLTPAQMLDSSHFKDPETGVELEIIDKVELIEWFSENYKQYGCRMEFVTDRSQEGSQFCKGFGGIGGTLRWSVDFSTMEVAEFDDGNMFGDSGEEYDDMGFADDFGF